ncbi:MAG: DUF1648 domain-containing protein [Rhodothermales bacterium]
MEVLAAIAAFFAVYFFVANFDDLPRLIPKHFNIRGEIDAWTSKKTLLYILPSLTVLFYVAITMTSRSLHKYSHMFNYPGTKTPEKTKQVYLLARHVLVTVKVSVVCLLSYLSWAIVSTGLSGENQLNILITIAFMLFSLIAPIVIYSRSPVK